MGERKLDDYITIEEAAVMLHMSERTLYQRHKEGAVKAYKPGKRLLFKVADLHLFIMRFPTS